MTAHWQDHSGDPTLISDQTADFSLRKHLIPFLCICVSAQMSCVPLIWKSSKEQPGRLSSKLSRLWLLKAHLVPLTIRKSANKSILVLKSL